MNFKSLFKMDSVGGLFKSLGITLSIVLLFSLIYFFIYLPGTTNHGETVTVPELKGMMLDELDKFLHDHDLRYSVNDSSYSSEFPPLTVLQQFPKAGSSVKEQRIIYVSVNRIAPPTLPVPDLVDRSLLNAEVVLKSNELKLGRILYKTGHFKNLVIEMLYKGSPIHVGTRIVKGSLIDLVVSDGEGPADFTLGNLVGDAYKTALFKLEGWNLHLGKIEIPKGVDTTGIEKFVYKQYPVFGDSVRVGDPINLWIGPKGYKGEEEQDEGTNH